VRVTVLGSGSGGNATLVQAGGARVLVDAGLGPRVVERRMRAALGRAVGLDAIVVTHAHGDHAGKVGPCARHFDAPVFLTEATRRRLSVDRVRTRSFSRDAPFAIGPVRVEPMPLPHDASQVALVLEHRGRHAARAAVVTDLGHVPRGLAGHLSGCQLVLLESNHDPGMLDAGPYPEFLKRRIASRDGHLSNPQAAHLLARLGPGIRDVVLMHVSRKCNSPALALGCARAALRGRRVKVRVADQDEPLDLHVRSDARAGRGAHEGQLALPL